MEGFCMDLYTPKALKQPAFVGPWWYKVIFLIPSLHGLASVSAACSYKPGPGMVHTASSNHSCQSNRLTGHAGAWECGLAFMDQILTPALTGPAAKSEPGRKQ